MQMSRIIMHFFSEIEGDDERSIKTLRLNMYTHIPKYIHDFDMNIL